MRIADARHSGIAGIRGRGEAPGEVRGGPTWPARGTRERVHRERDGCEEVNEPARRKEAGQGGGGMKRYFDSIAEAIERRKSIYGAREGPSAVERMAALRRRVASRARGAGAGSEAVTEEAQRECIGRESSQPRGASEGEEVAAADRRRSADEPSISSIKPSCSTASTEAAAAVAFHTVAGIGERMNVAEDRRHGPTAESLAGWHSRQGLLDRLRASGTSLERTA